MRIHSGYDCTSKVEKGVRVKNSVDKNCRFDNELQLIRDSRMID